MIPPHLSRLLIASLALAFLLLSGSRALAAPPDETRPYLELPFLNGSDYEVTCGYGCYQHKGSMSYAVDFAVPEGDPIVAAAPGEVMAITWEMGLPANLNLGDALIVYIDHGDGWFTRYVHLAGITVAVGETVAMGDIIGYGGKTGASGDHLHFELKYGSSLHSPSVPINELFGGQEPQAGSSYLSNNRALSVKLPPAAAPATVTATATALSSLPDSPSGSVAAPQVSQSLQSRLPQVEVALALSASSVLVGTPVTATFTLRNTTNERLHLALLGVGGRTTSTAAPLDSSLFFDRSIVLNPGRSYEFVQYHTFTTPGDLELFIFALGPHNEWVPLDGAAQSAALHIEAARSSVYLPLVASQAPMLPATGAAPAP